MNSMIRFAAIAGFVALPLLANAQETHDHGAMKAKEAGTQTGYEKALMDAHMKMMKEMDMKPTGDPDKDFVTMMIPHHQGAVDMAKVQLKYGKDPELKALAEKIIAEQEKEIGQMQRWRERQ